MKLSTRFALVGIGALAALSMVQHARTKHYEEPESVVYLLGVLPNLAAAIAIPFVLLSVWADQESVASYPSIRRRFFILSFVAGVGLIVWEFMQSASRSLHYDNHDIGATILGLFLGWMFFALIMSYSNLSEI